MKDGDITAVLRTSSGYQILKLEASTPRQIAPFEKVRDQVSERVYEEKQAAESRKYLEKLRAQALDRVEETPIFKRRTKRACRKSMHHPPCLLPSRSAAAELGRCSVGPPRLRRSLRR